MSRFSGGKVIAVSLIVAIVGFALCGVGLAVDPRRTWHAYLSAYAFAASIAVGGLVLLMAGYAISARWMAVPRRLIEAVTMALPALAVLFIPIVIGAAELYPWHSPNPDLADHVHHLIHHREAYLNLPGFIARAALYFAIWMAAAELLRAWSVRRDDRGVPPGDPRDALTRERNLSTVMLPAVGLAITFAAIDWVMTLEPAWFSTIFGVYYFAGGFVASIALVTLLAARARRRDDMAEIITRHHFHALGRLLFAFVIFWAYAAFFQAMLISIANKPEEVEFYLARTEGAWSVFIYILVLGHFAAPFLALLPRRVKMRPRAMVIASCWILAMHAIDVHWLVVPRAGLAVIHWVDFAAQAAVLGVVIAFAAWRQHGVAVVAANDPMFADGRRYRSPL